MFAPNQRALVEAEEMIKALCEQKVQKKINSMTKIFLAIFPNNYCQKHGIYSVETSIFVILGKIIRKNIVKWKSKYEIKYYMLLFRNKRYYNFLR